MKEVARIFVGLVALTTRCFSADASTHEWEVYVKGKHLDSVLLSVGAGNLRQWPFVYSSACDPVLSTEDRQLQPAFRKASDRLLADIAILSTQRVATISVLTSNTTAILKLRHLLYQRPSYVNLLMADALNRLLIVQLAEGKRLRNAEFQGATSNLIALARESLFPAEAWRVVIDQELRKKSFGQLVNPVLKTSEVAAQTCREIWIEMGRQDDILASADANRMAIVNLQRDQDMAPLLQRYIKTDALMRLVEMIHEYMAQNPSATICDGVAQIATVFPMDSHARTTLTAFGPKTERVLPRPCSKLCIEEVLSGQQFSALNVAGLLGLIERGQLDALVSYSLSSTP